MPYEVFEQKTRSYKPVVSITENGTIGLNGGVYNRFSVSKYNFVVLLYDKERKRVGIKLVKNEDEKGARKLRHRKKVLGGDVSARPFLDYYQIKFAKKTSRYDPFWDDEAGVIAFEIDKPLPSKQ